MATEPAEVLDSEELEILTEEPIFDNDETDQSENVPKPSVGEYWKVKNGAHFLYAKVSKENPLELQYFSPTVKGNFYSLNENPYSVCLEDLQEKIDPPDTIMKGRHRKFYLF